MAFQIGSSSNLLELCFDQFPNWFCQLGVLNNDPTVWLDGARPPTISLWVYKKRFVSRINPSLLPKINLQNTRTLQLNNINQIKSKWNCLQKITKGSA